MRWCGGESTPFVEFMLEVILESIQSSVNTEEKIWHYLAENPKATIRELAEVLGLSTRAIEKQIAALKLANRLHRIGSARKGYWEVLG